MRWILFKQVDRLVAIAVLSAIALTWALLTGFDAFTAFVSEISEVGRGQYTLIKIVAYVMLTVPRRAYELFGNAALIGSLLGLGTLAASGELTALRAAGLSKLRICSSVVFAITGLTLLVAMIGETIGPYGEQKAQSLSIAAKAKEVALSRGGGLWARDGSSVINAKRGRTRQSEAGAVVELDDVRVFEFTPQGRLSAIAVAKTATHHLGEWIMQDVRRTEFSENSAISKDQKTVQWASGLDPRLLSLSIVHPQYMALRDLARNIGYLQRNNQDASSFQQAYWARIFYPLNVLVLAFCSVPFAFGALRTGGMGKRLFLGMTLAVSFYFAQRAIVSMGVVYGFNLVLANALPALSLIFLAVVYFRWRS